MTDLDGLPGAELITAGLRDAAQGRTSTASLLVEIAAPRLRALGLPVPPSGSGEAELRLYDELGRTGAPDPYGEYNALLRRLTSFTRALERRRARSQ